MAVRIGGSTQPLRQPEVTTGAPPPGSKTPPARPATGHDTVPCPASADTGGQALGEEGHQLLAAGVRERLGAEHVVQDREPHELGEDHGGPDRGLVAADALGEDPELGAVEVPPEQLDRAGLRGRMQQEQ